MTEKLNSNSGTGLDAILDRLVNGAVYLFALWTLACHLTVLVSGGLRWAMILFMALCGVVLAVLLKWRRRGMAASAVTTSAAPEPPVPDDGPPLRTKWLFLVWGAALMFTVFPSWQCLGLFWAAGLIYLLAAFVVIRSPAPMPARPAGEPAGGLVLVLALGLAVLALMVCRPDMDDAYHLNVAVTMAAAPGEPIMSRTTMVFGEPGFFWLPPVYKLQTLETLVAAASWLTHLPAIVVAHFGLTAIGAVAIVLCLWRLLRQLAPGFAFWPLLAMVFYLMADGGSNASFGNHSGMVRLHQGRILFLGALLPLASAYALEFMRAPSPAAFWRLAAVQTASIGITATAMVMAPLMVVMTLLAMVGFPGQTWKRVGHGLLSCAYPLLLGIVCIATMRGYGGETPTPPVMPTASALWSHVVMTVLGRHPLAFAPVFLALVAWLVAPNAVARRYAVALPLFAWLTVFNPWLSRLMAATIMPEPIYFRVLWQCLPVVLVALTLSSLASSQPTWRHRLLPLAACAFPFLLAYLYNTGDPFGIGFRLHSPDWRQTALWNGCLLAFLVLLGLAALVRLPAGRRGPAGAALALLALFFCLVPVFPVLAPDNAFGGARLSIGRPGIKVDPAPYAVASLINEKVPAGAAVLAPDEVTAWIPTASRHALPLLPRVQYLGMFYRVIGAEETGRRYRLLCAVSGDDPDLAVQSLGEGLACYPLAAVCLAKPAPDDRREALLRQRGFESIATGTPYSLWVRR